MTTTLGARTPPTLADSSAVGCSSGAFPKRQANGDLRLRLARLPSLGGVGGGVDSQRGDGSRSLLMVSYSDDVGPRGRCVVEGSMRCWGECKSHSIYSRVQSVQYQSALEKLSWQEFILNFFVTLKWQLILCIYRVGSSSTLRTKMIK